MYFDRFDIAEVCEQYRMDIDTQPFDGVIDCLGTDWAITIYG